MTFKAILFLAIHSLLVRVSAERLHVGLRGKDHVVSTRRPRLHLVGFPGQDKDKFPLDECMGHCNSNADCKGALACFRRTSFEEVPGCLGIGGEGRSYCYDTSSTRSPTATPTLAPTRSELTVLDDSKMPFGKCEGVCRKDSDCKGNLKCQKRSAYEYVPGCDGYAAAGANICYDHENDGPAPPQLPKGPFKLRMYWEKGYLWQESPIETFWCVESNPGGPALIDTCDRKSITDLEFVYAAGAGDMIKVAGEDLCLDLNATRKRSAIFSKCDENRAQQRWEGVWSSRRFDIRSYTRLEECLSNHHHPRRKEELFVWPCRTAHKTTTGYWELIPK